MKITSIAGFFVLLAFSIMAHASDDDANIRAEIDGYLAAWNAGDADALASYYMEDGDRVNNSGDTFVGRSAIREHYKVVFSRSLTSGIDRQLIYHSIAVRILSSDAAVVDVAYEVNGLRAEVDFPVHGRNTIVMIKNGGRWMRAAHRNSLQISQSCLKQCDADGLLAN
jgi:uncharacterized protein (TIGR02246 family)